MNTPTLYLDSLIFASTIYPSGFSHSLYSFCKGVPRAGSTEFLAFLAIPYFALCWGVFAVHPGLFAWRSTRVAWLIAALIIPWLVLFTEFSIHGLAMYFRTGRMPNWFAVHALWQGKLSLLGWILFGVVVVGEEFVYRAMGIGILHQGLGLPLIAAVGLTSAAYGLNHLAFGGLSVLSKSVAGLSYGLVYVFGGQCIVLPILAHGMQNVALFALARDSHA